MKCVFRFHQLFSLHSDRWFMHTRTQCLSLVNLSHMSHVCANETVDLSFTVHCILQMMWHTHICSVMQEDNCTFSGEEKSVSVSLCKSLSLSLSFHLSTIASANSSSVGSVHCTVLFIIVRERERMYERLSHSSSCITWEWMDVEEEWHVWLLDDEKIARTGESRVCHTETSSEWKYKDKCNEIKWENLIKDNCSTLIGERETNDARVKSAHTWREGERDSSGSRNLCVTNHLTLQNIRQ